MKRITTILLAATATLFFTACGGGSSGTSNNSSYSLAGKTVYSIVKEKINDYDYEQTSTMSFDTHIETVHITVVETMSGESLTYTNDMVDEILPLTGQDNHKYHFEGIVNFSEENVHMEAIVDTTEIAKGYVEGTFILKRDDGINYTSSSVKYYYDKNEAYENSN